LSEQPAISSNNSPMLIRFCERCDGTSIWGAFVKMIIYWPNVAVWGKQTGLDPGEAAVPGKLKAKNSKLFNCQQTLSMLICIMQTAMGPKQWLKWVNFYLNN